MTILGLLIGAALGIFAAVMSDYVERLGTIPDEETMQLVERWKTLTARIRSQLQR